MPKITKGIDPSAKQRSWLLRIEHKHGDNLYLKSTEKLAKKELERYVREWWEQEMGRKVPARLSDDDIDEYFERSEEFWGIEEIELDE